MENASSPDVSPARVAAYSKLVRGMSDCAFIGLDLEGRIVRWHENATDITGYAEGEAVGQNFDFLYSEQHRVAGAPRYALNNAHAQGRFHTMSWRLRKDGSEFWAGVTVTPVIEEDGSHTGYVMLLRDHTNEREAARAVSERERSFRLLVQSVVDYAIYMLDPDGRVANWNAGAERAKGYKAEEIVGRHFSVFYPEDARTRGEPEKALETARTKGKFEAEGWRVRKDGSRFWAHVVIDPIHNENGEFIGYAKITKDCTERDDALKTARESENRFRLLVKGVTDYAIYMLDTGGHVTNWNAGAERAKGYTEDEILGQHFAVFYSEEDRRNGLPEIALETARSEGRFEGVGWRCRKDGSRFWANVVIDAIYDERGELAGFAKITRDITRQKADQDRMRGLLADQRETAAELERSMKQAMAANEAKSAFLATMSHEIRTPLNGVLGMAQVMMADSLSDEQRERMQIILDSGEALLTILNDVLDISKIEAGELKLKNEEFSLPDMLDTVVATFSGAALEKGVDIRAQAAPGCPGKVEGDPARLRQILTNLVSNAVKFTHDGHVTLRAGAGPEGGVRFTVTDSGIGIAADQIGTIFDKFAQADSTSTRKYGGSGLGLAICRQLARAMGGEVSAESEAGKGSVFTLDLPLRRCGPVLAEAPAETTAASAPEEADSHPGLEILIAEDNEVNRLVAEAMLRPTGARLHMVENGAHAVEACAARDFDLVLMDVRMPVMDGVEATRRIREMLDEQGRAQIPVIALTANALDHQVGEYREAGMDDTVTKPLTQQVLLDAIDRVLEDYEGGGEVTRASA